MRSREDRIPPSRTVIALTVIVSLTMLVPGVWAWLAPSSFAAAVNWPTHTHFAHDAGVFQIAIGLVLLAALAWRDALSVTLAGFMTASALHAFNHVRDLALGGGSPLDPVGLSVFTALGALALGLRIRQLRTRTRTNQEGRA